MSQQSPALTPDDGSALDIAGGRAVGDYIAQVRGEGGFDLPFVEYACAMTVPTDDAAWFQAAPGESFAFTVGAVPVWLRAAPVARSVFGDGFQAAVAVARLAE